MANGCEGLGFCMAHGGWGSGQEPTGPTIFVMLVVLVVCVWGGVGCVEPVAGRSI